MKQWCEWGAEINFEEMSSEIPSAKVVSIQYHHDCRRVCKCSVPLKGGPERWSMSRNSGTPTCFIALPFFFFFLNLETAIQCVSRVTASLWWNQTFHFQESPFLEFSKEQEYWVFYHNGDFLQEKKLSSKHGGMWKSWYREGSGVYCSEMAAMEKTHAGFSATVLLHALTFQLHFFCPTRQCMKQQSRLEITQLQNIIWRTVKNSLEWSIILDCDGVEMIMLWNGFWCRTKCCHSSKFQHPALTISHPQILPAEGQALCLQSEWELWGCNPSWLQQELRHLGAAESCLQHALTPLPKGAVRAELLLGRGQQFSAASRMGICPWGIKA